jgi:hypothetical protein
LFISVTQAAITKKFWMTEPYPMEVSFSRTAQSKAVVVVYRRLSYILEPQSSLRSASAEKKRESSTTF